LHGNLAGQGVPSMDEAYQELHLAPLLQPFGALMSATLLRDIHDNLGDLALVSAFAPRMQDFLDVLATRLDIEIDAVPLLVEIQRDLSAIYSCEARLGESAEYPELRALLRGQFPDEGEDSLPTYRILLAWALLRHLGSVLPPDDGATEEEHAYKVAATSGAWIREWFLRKYIAQAFQALGADPKEAAADASLVRICVSHAHHIVALETEIWGPLIRTIFRDGDVESFLGVNTWQGQEWLNKERLETMLNTLLLSLHIRAQAEENLDWDKLAMAHDATVALEEAAAGTDYDYGWMLTCVK
ncbi:MAG: hypothetical protein L3K26_15115, partial [Candidatus Hydrogenedentes bacterium]|nr:hypothetical protein [Candidatus Hydrogenedentota bacterium]